MSLTGFNLARRRAEQAKVEAEKKTPAKEVTFSAKTLDNSESTMADKIPNKKRKIESEE